MEWQELASAMNAGSDYQLLIIGHRMKKSMADRNCYQRCLVQRTVFHEDLFSIYLGWVAIFDESLKYWVWELDPQDDGSPVNAVDNDCSNAHYKPRLIPTSHGDIFQIGEDVIVFPEYSYPIDPVVKVERKDNCGYDLVSVYGGIYVLPPSYKVKLYANQVKLPNQ